jgi:hypothetical protein
MVQSTDIQAVRTSPIAPIPDYAANCLREWELPDGQEPDRFLGQPICPSCYADLYETLHDLKGKGVTVAVAPNDASTSQIIGDSENE